MGLRIKKGDQVFILSGRNKGSRGKVLQVMPESHRAIVEGVNFVKRHVRARGRGQPGGIQEREAAIHLSNLMLIDPKTNQPSRFKTVVKENGSKVRVSKKSNNEI